MLKKGTGYSKDCLVCLMLVCRLGKKYFIENRLVLLVSGKDFQPK